MPLDQVSDGYGLSEEQVTMLRTIFPYGHDSIPDYNITPSMRRELVGLSDTGLVFHKVTDVTGVWCLTQEGMNFLKN